ncbi:MAG: hypothetical protein ACYTF1_20625 [Planctomycetota bacterium]|jgi:hypothetical protein
MRKLILWISLLEVIPLAKSENDDVQGAFVNGLVVAESESDAQAAFDSALREIGWSLISMEDTEPFEKRCAEFKVSDELKQLAIVTKEAGKPQFDTFRAWPDNGDNCGDSEDDE